MQRTFKQRARNVGMDTSAADYAGSDALPVINALEVLQTAGPRSFKAAKAHAEKALYDYQTVDFEEALKLKALISTAKPLPQDPQPSRNPRTGLQEFFDVQAEIPQESVGAMLDGEHHKSTPEEHRTTNKLCWMDNGRIVGPTALGDSAALGNALIRGSQRTLDKSGGLAGGGAGGQTTSPISNALRGMPGLAGKHLTRKILGTASAPGIIGRMVPGIGLAGMLTESTTLSPHGYWVDCETGQPIA